MTRIAALTLALFVLGCGSPRAASSSERALATLDGFLHASPVVSELLADAAAWAVFGELEDTRTACRHEGLLFLPDGATHAVALRCTARPSEPAGVTYHELVVLLDPADVERLLDRTPLELEDAAHVGPHDGPDDVGSWTRGPATRWIVTTRRRALLFDPFEPEQRLELAGTAGAAGPAR